MKRKTKIEPTVVRARERVDVHVILQKLLDLKILTWRYKHEPSHVRHIGPIAEEFAAAFGVGSNDRTITISDAVGVAYASIKALHEMIEDRRRELAELRRALAKARR